MDTSYIYLFARNTTRGEYQTDRNDFLLNFRENADDDTSNTCSKFSEREEADDDEGVAREQRE